MNLEAANKMDEERNEVNWHIVEKDRSKVSSLIKGVGRVNNMEEVAMTCANICARASATGSKRLAVIACRPAG